MSIKGFIGFWGNVRESKMTKSLCDKYVLAICDGVSFFNERYTVVLSNEYLMAQDDDRLVFKSGKDKLSNNDVMMATIEVSSKGLKIERDRWGTRMIYYVQDGENIYFSSDIRFLLELPLSQIKEYDCISLIECTTIGYIYDEMKTLFKRIKQLPRNSILEKNKVIFTIQKNIVTGNKNRFDLFEEASVLFANKFEKCVADTCLINGKRAYLLSGGMDSSAIAIAASKVEQIDTITFSSGDNYEDIYYANELAKYIRSRHTIIDFNGDDAIIEIPSFLHDIENIEFEGIFSPLGGFAYYLLCKEIGKAGYDIVFPGEGADELLGGYYWQLTHTFGFVDNLREKTFGTSVYDKVISLFPEVEERNIYREIAYYLLQGTALTNYHLSCVEHVAKANGLFNYPVFMCNEIYDVLKDVPMKWLCDGNKTKLILRNYLANYLEPIGLTGLITRKKLAMPSVVTSEFHHKLYELAEKEATVSNNPFRETLCGKSMNVFMLDVFHKYFTLHPMETVYNDMWKEDMVRIKNGESIIYW